MALRYLTCYLGAMVQLIMLFLTTTVAVATTIGLMLTILLAAMALLSLIRVTHPPAPPYRAALLFRQVRIHLGLSPNLNIIDDMTAKTTEVTTEVDDHQLLLLEL